MKGLWRAVILATSKWELPFLAIERLMRVGVSFHVAATIDPRLMPAEERRNLVRRLRGILSTPQPPMPLEHPIYLPFVLRSRP